MESIYHYIVSVGWNSVFACVIICIMSDMVMSQLYTKFKDRIDFVEKCALEIDYNPNAIEKASSMFNSGVHLYYFMSLVNSVAFFSSAVCVAAMWASISYK